ncbi:MAG: L,D-transpeptidase family protein [Ancalomicrobiaceae bacterium]|nr:L,D-transpeptidase family protein [Ancalomicrobiaceae bacterium]
MQRKRKKPQLIRVARRPGTRSEGILSFGSTVLLCRLGRTGISRMKREGDGATPAGRLGLIGLYYRADRRLPPGSRLAARPITDTLGWCDDPADGRYNRPVDLPFTPSHERMRRDDGLYDVVGILDWNVTRRVLGRGSAIFLHIAKDDGTPTAGCIALSAADMRRLLPRLKPGAVFEVV